MASNLDNEASFLTTEYGVMKTVLSQLPIKQLNKAATVCKAWNNTSKIIKKSRKQIYTYGRVEESKSENAFEDMKAFVKVVRSEPQLCLLFLTTQGRLDSHPSEPAHILRCEDCNQRRKKEKYKIEAILQTQLPNTCRLIGGVTSGVILSNMSLEATEIEETDAFGIFLLPEFANVTIGDFYLDHKKMKQVTKAIVNRTEDVGHLLNLQQPDQIKCIILIALGISEEKHLEAVCKYVQERNPKVAIGGGFLETLIHPDVQRHVCSGIVGLTFSGARVRADSIVIPQNITAPPEVEKLIVQLKQGHELGKRSIGFMFACVARGTNVYGRTGVESSLFRKHFPTTPLLGFFGNGEIGTNSMGEQPRKMIPSAAKKSRTTYLYSYSTTFVLLSFLD